MITELSEALDRLRDPAARTRLQKCLPWIQTVVEQIDSHVACRGLVVAVATPNGATVLSADGWPELTTTADCTSGDAALALVAAIESDSMHEGDVIVGGLTLLLGKAGLAAQQLDAELIAGDGARPLVVALLDRERTSITVMITTISMPVMTQH